MARSGRFATRILTAVTLGLFMSLGFALTAQAAFPGEKGRIAFEQWVNAGPDVYTMNPDGSDMSQLTANAGRNDRPAWSPNGRRIAFVSTRDGNSEIYVMDANGLGQTRLTTDPGFDSDPTWSPDGQKIVFSTTRSGNSDIWGMNADGSAQTNLTNTSSEGEREPAWSPDGGKIAFVLGATDGSVNVAVMDPDGTGRAALTHYVPGSRSSYKQPDRPTWSPDGQRIAYELAFGGDSHFFNTITVMNADGGNAFETGSIFFQDHSPAWSPDGADIIFHCCGGLNLVRPEARGDITGIPGTSEAYRPDWQPIVPEPQRSDFKNGPAYCRALQDFLGDDAFRARFGMSRNGANAFGKCVSSG